MTSENSINPWKTLTTTKIYENPWIKVREDQVIRPDGNQGIYGVVDPQKIATGVVALTAKNEVYLVGQFRYPTNEYSWEIIEGGAEKTESPLDAAKRELAEEAGITATSWKPLLGELHLSNCISSERGFLFLAQNLSFGTATPDPTEILALKKVPLKEAVEMIYRGEIKDTLSIIGLIEACRIT